VQARRSQTELVAVLAVLDDRHIRRAVEAERAVLSATGGTCRAPVGALGETVNGRFRLLVAGVNLDGSGMRVEHVEGPAETALRLAADAGRRLAAEVALR
jgi:hydroxymethylbilane synthase